MELGAAAQKLGAAVQEWLSPLCRAGSWHRQRRNPLIMIGSVVLLLLTGLLLFNWNLASAISAPRINMAAIKRCAIGNLHADELSMLERVEPLEAHEFTDRRARVAGLLAEDSVDAYVLEPGDAFRYFTNISREDWETEDPDGPPFFLIIFPETSDGQVSSKSILFLPKFFEDEVRALLVLNGDLEIVPWLTYDPYEELFESGIFGGGKGTRLMVDKHVSARKELGLHHAGFWTMPTSPQVEDIERVKSSAEVGIVRAAQTATVAAIRAARSCLVVGMTQEDVTDIFEVTERAVGLQPASIYVSYRANITHPFADLSTYGLRLTHDTLLYVSTSAYYLEYTAEIARSVVIEPPKQRVFASEEAFAKKQKVWDLAYDALKTAGEHLQTANRTLQSIEDAARIAVDEAGYGDGFSLAFSSGIGQWGEIPLVSQRRLPGTLYFIESKIHVEGEFRVQHKDAFVIREHGGAELLMSLGAGGLQEP